MNEHEYEVRFINKNRSKQMQINVTIHDEIMACWVDANELYVQKLLQAVADTLRHDHGMEDDVEVVIGEKEKEEDKFESLKGMTFTPVDFVKGLEFMLRRRKSDA